MHLNPWNAWRNCYILLNDREIGRIGDRVIGRSGEQQIGRSGDRVIGRTGDRVIGRSGDRENRDIVHPCTRVAGSCSPELRITRSPDWRALVHPISGSPHHPITRSPDWRSVVLPITRSPDHHPFFTASQRCARSMLPPAKNTIPSLPFCRATRMDSRSRSGGKNPGGGSPTSLSLMCRRFKTA